MKTLKEILQLATQFLEKHQTSRPKRSAEELIAHVLHMKRVELYMNFDRPIEEQEKEQIRLLLKRRATHEPIEYILGKVDFFGCEISVTQDVLIPRPETEILVAIAKKNHLETKEHPLQVWDLCTGSGCIGLALKKTFSNWNVILSDISENALAIAKKNAELNHLKVEIRQGNFLEPFSGEKADIIFCNPPYLSKKEYNACAMDLKNFEPKMAFLSEENGLKFYREFAQKAPNYLNDKAKIYLEIGHTQKEEVSAFFQGAYWQSIQCEQDWAGHDRYMIIDFNRKR